MPATWSFDDMIVYALDAFPERATSVLNRVRDAPDAELLGGEELLATRILHILSERDDLRTIDEAVRALYGDDLTLVEDACLLRETGRHGAHLAAQAAAELPEPIRFRLAARAFKRALESCNTRPNRRVNQVLRQTLPRELILEFAREIEGRAAARVLAVAADRPATVNTAAALLVRIDPDWRPGRCDDLSGADLEGARWAGADLRKAIFLSTNLSGANLSRADLRESGLSFARVVDASFAGARLDGADCDGIDAVRASFAGAGADHTRFRGAFLEETSFEYASLRGSDLSGARLDRADFSFAQLRHARLGRATVDETNFTGADLRGAYLSRADLRTARLDGATMTGVALVRASLERVTARDLTLDGASLCGALLTAASLPKAAMPEANLRGAGLAHVELEGADLRAADLTHASFHLGSSRSGLVGSVIAGEGSRTGFYTDDYGDKGFREPETIRKATLCGADLRGAKVEDCDFYLVDLRRARYHPEQGEHFRRCGAIL